jgi:hypothetical protein
MDQPKAKKLGKLYGNPNFSTGPKAGMGDQSAANGNGSKGSFATGPRQNDASIGHKAKGAGSESGTERDEKAEDKG